MRDFFAKYSLMLAIVFGLLGAVTAYAYLKNARAEGATKEPTISVVVAKKEIPSRSALTADQLEVRELSLSARLPGSYSSVDEIAGTITKEPIHKGTQIIKSNLADQPNQAGLAGLIPEGKRAVSVGVTEVIGSGGLIIPGDRVDVIAVLKTTSGINNNTLGSASVVLQNVLVLAVAQAITGNDVTLKPNAKDSTDAGPKAKTVTLAVSLAEAERLVLAEETGKLRLALRRADDNDIEKVPDLVIPITSP